MSYYDPDSILTTQTKVPCTFNLSVPGLGYLAATATNNTGTNPSNSSSPAATPTGGQTTATTLTSGTTVPLPLWLGTLLAVSNTSNLDADPFVSLDFPGALSTPVLNALKADPVSVDVRAQSPHFYDLGTKLLELFEEDELVDVLTDTLFVAAHDGAARVRDWVASLKQTT
ncbi:hypothetical protein DV735_g3862, partial [Chaetothyriales sp. CBS 134920]